MRPNVAQALRSVSGPECRKSRAKLELLTPQGSRRCTALVSDRFSSPLHCVRRQCRNPIANSQSSAPSPLCEPHLEIQDSRVLARQQGKPVRVERYTGPAEAAEKEDDKRDEENHTSLVTKLNNLAIQSRSQQSVIQSATQTLIEVYEALVKAHESGTHETGTGEGVLLSAEKQKVAELRAKLDDAKKDYLETLNLLRDGILREDDALQRAAQTAFL